MGIGLQNPIVQKQNEFPKMIYLDNHSTTPCDPRVFETMLPYFSVSFGNPASTIHRFGREAAEAIEKARKMVASLIGAKPKEIVFTSGATESNNISIQGLVRGNKSNRKKIVTTAIEHKAILNQCNALKKIGYDIAYLPLNKYGEIDLEAAEEVIDECTFLVTVQTANNEIGTIQDISRLAYIARNVGAFIHTDAAQAIGKIDIDVKDLGVDLLSISAHKFYGPKGVGALYIKDGPYSMPIQPLVYGGEQESNLRSGTLNVPGIIGLGKACEICSMELVKDYKNVSQLRDYIEGELKKTLNVSINGAINNRLPNNSSITIKDMDTEALIVNMPTLALSTGSACTSGALEPSHVLQAIGMSRDIANNTFRIGLGRFNTQLEVEQAADTIVRTYLELSKYKD